MQQKYVTQKNIFLKCVGRPTFKVAYPLGPQRVACMNDKKSIKIKQPYYPGFQILELAKKPCTRFGIKRSKLTTASEPS